MPIVSVDIEAHVLPNRQGSFVTSLGSIDSALLSVVRLTSTEGPVGFGPVAIGTTLISGESHESAAHVIRQIAVPRLLGRDPMDVEAIMSSIERAVPGNDRAKAAIDIALHDLTAQILGIPLYGLLGGLVRDRIPILRLVGMATPDAMVERVLELADQGFRYFKLKLGSDPTSDLARVAVIREALGPEAHLMIDLNQAYRPKEAVAALQKLERHGIDMVEQPVAEKDIEGLGFVRRHSPIPIEADEAVKDLADAMAVARAGAADYISIKLGKAGGIRNAMKLAAVCQAANIGIVIGYNGGGQLLEAANMHFIASTPSVDYACEVGEYERLSGDPASGLVIEAGHLLVPTGVGLGIQVDFQSPVST